MKVPKGHKRVLLCGDLHCGHQVGLTPPAWQQKPADPDDYKFLSVHLRHKFHKIQDACWKFWVSEITKLKPFHLAICNGDTIDGNGSRSGGVELIAPDRQEQADMAMKALSVVRAKNYCFTFGTPYHTGTEEDFETRIAEWMDAQAWTNKVTIGSHEWPEVNGKVFDVKHKVGGSGIPHGRATAVIKEDLWNAIWAENKAQPRADIIIRSHVHYFSHYMKYRGDSEVHMATLPALQAMGTKFGSRQCSGTVDYGFSFVDIGPKGEIKWHNRILPTSVQAASTTKF
ncbi:MAG: hypothetical protein GY807_24775 [Gammaproteobacteria bacterium]|nr:hypothetical protein [Gammaproteobacteria bacterium]